MEIIIRNLSRLSRFSEFSEKSFSELLTFSEKESLARSLKTFSKTFYFFFQNSE